MKQFLFFAYFLVSAQFLSAQVVLEQSYNYSGTFATLEQSGDKFYIMDVPNEQCKIYNTNHSIWKTINLSIPTDYYLYDVNFISENLFNSDNALEILYIYYKYVSSGDYYVYESRIINENGDELLKVPGGGYCEIKQVGENNKLMVYVFDYSVSPYTIQTKVYNIGQAATPIMNPVASNQLMLNDAYPNPSNSYFTIPYQIPEGVDFGNLQLLDINGKILQNHNIDSHFDHLKLNTSTLRKGVYLYKISTQDGYTSESKKLIVQ